MADAFELWLGLGKSWAGFWRSTPYEVGKIVAAVQKHQHRAVIMSGWYAEYFARQKRLKSLSHYLDETKPKTLVRNGEALKAAPWLALMGVGNTLSQ